jgi:hypothetical protein
MNGFENAMDQVNSALEKFGGPFFLGRKVLHTNPRKRSFSRLPSARTSARNWSAYECSNPRDPGL